MRHAEVMESLKRRVHALRDCIDRSSPIVLVDYHVTNNLGDLLIHVASDEFFRANGYRVVAEYARQNFLHDHTPIPDGATIVFEAGGNTGDLYPAHQELRERIIARRQRNRIVILPQTMHFRSPAAMERAMAIYRAHPDLVACARDLETERLLKEHGVRNAMLVPDPAHVLWGVYPRMPGEPGSEIYMTRGLFEGDDPAAPRKGPAGTDWKDAFTLLDRLALRGGLELHALDARLRNTLPASWLWRHLCRARLMSTAIRLLAPYETVTCDRMHVMLLALLLDKNVIARNSGYGKVARYVETFLADDDQLRMGPPIGAAAAVAAGAE
jgi:pyruvyl transferase EpsO